MMGRAHAYAYRAAPLIRPSSVVFTPVVMSGRNAETVAKASEDCGIETWVTDWRQLIERSDVDVVDICTPPGTHSAIIEAAALAGQRPLAPLVFSPRPPAKKRDNVTLFCYDSGAL